MRVLSHFRPLFPNLSLTVGPANCRQSISSDPGQSSGASPYDQLSQINNALRRYGVQMPSLVLGINTEMLAVVQAQTIHARVYLARLVLSEGLSQFRSVQNKADKFLCNRVTSNIELIY